MAVLPSLYKEEVCIAMLAVFTVCEFFGESESSEDEQLTPEKARQYLLDKYKAEVKQNHPEIDFNNSEDTVDFCLKLQCMDDDSLEMAYNKIKEQNSE